MKKTLCVALSSLLAWSPLAWADSQVSATPSLLGAIQAIFTPNTPAPAAKPVVKKAAPKPAAPKPVAADTANSTTTTAGPAMAAPAGSTAATTIAAGQNATQPTSTPVKPSSDHSLRPLSGSEFNGPQNPNDPDYYWDENTSLILKGQDGAPGTKPPAGYTIINADTLRTLVLRNSKTILRSFLSLQTAKEQFNLANTNLLPSLNIQGAETGGIFSLSSLGYTAPFLIPSNWFKIGAAGGQLENAAYGFYLGELNQYATAYALYMSILADYEMVKAYKESATESGDQIQEKNQRMAVMQQAAQQIGQTVDTSQNVKLVKNLQTLQARTNAQAAQALQSLAADEATLRATLGLGTKANFAFLKMHLNPLRLERFKVPDPVDRVAIEKSPEIKEINAQILSATSNKIAGLFGFFTQVQVQPKVTNSTKGVITIDNSNLTYQEQVQGLGFSIVPTYHINQLTIRDLGVQVDLAKQAIQEAVESNMSQIAAGDEAITVLDQELDQNRENLRDSAGEDKPNIAQVIQNAQQVVNAQVSLIRVRLAMDHARIGLLRSTIDGPFSPRNLPMCDMKLLEQHANFFESLFSIVDPNLTEQTMSQVCHVQGPIAHPSETRERR